MSEFFQDNGTLAADAPSYVHRHADDELQALCRRGGLAYVLAARQSGKSSLVNRAIDRLRSDTMLCARVDLSTIGAEDVDVERWYASIISSIVDQLGIDFEFEAWWTDHAVLTPPTRLFNFFVRVLGSLEDLNCAIFIDEIDSTLNLPFSRADFFATIRGVYNSRTSEPGLAGLSIVLIGVAAPQELIEDPRRTPFNVGTAITVADLGVEETLDVFERGFPTGRGGRKIVERVLFWTGGHPRLTQRLCMVLSQAAEARVGDVDRLVEETLLGPAGSSDETMRSIQQRVDLDVSSDRWLSLYRRVLAGKSTHMGPTDELAHLLALVGLVRVDAGGSLRPRNRIFRRAFDERWIRKSARRKPARVGLLVAVALLAVVFAGWRWWSAFEAKEARKIQLLEEFESGGPSLALLALLRLSDEFGVPDRDLSGLLTAHERVVLYEMVAETGHSLPSADAGRAVLLLSRILWLDCKGNLSCSGALLAGLDTYTARDRRTAGAGRVLRSEIVDTLRAYSQEIPILDQEDWITFPGGSFFMGSRDRRKRPRFEWPAHKVTLDGFRLLRTEVTVANWRRLQAKYRPEADGQLPAHSVSWYAANAYAAWLGGRLPTEAEWEYAARSGGREQTFPWGDAPADCDHAVMNVGDWRDSGQFACGMGGPAPVCSRPAGNTAQGACDMSGNVEEWVADWNSRYPSRAVQNPLAQPGHRGALRVRKGRVLRGGAYTGVADKMHVTHRAVNSAARGFRQIGFRVAADLPSQ